MSLMKMVYIIIGITISVIIAAKVCIVDKRLSHGKCAVAGHYGSHKGRRRTRRQQYVVNADHPHRNTDNHSDRAYGRSRNGILERVIISG